MTEFRIKLAFMKKLTLISMWLALVTVAGAQSWSLTGNTGTNPATNFVGTRDNQPLLFKINNTYSGEINSNGKTALGYGAAQGGAGTYSTAIGYRALNANPGYENVAIGAYTLPSSSGGYNVAVGYAALELNTSGNSNTATGYGAMLTNSVGYNNCAYGFNTMRSNTYGNFNTAYGYQALFYTTGSQYNTAVGYNAGFQYDLGYNNTILGANCGGSFAGQYNMVAIGQGVVCPDNSTARIGNSATWSIGGYAGWSNFSDGRYKQDIKENVKGLDFIMKLRPITYRLNVNSLSQRLKENNGEEWSAQMKAAMTDKEKMVLTGFVAQEVEKAASDAGFEFSGVDKPRTENGLYALRYAEFVVPLVKAIQEQQTMIQELQNQVQTLQGQADVAIVLSDNGGSADKVLAYPDPVVNSMTVSINTQNAGGGTLSVYDAGGQLIRQMGITVQQGINTFNLSMPTVAAGYYTLKLDWGNNMHKAISFVKSK
jgi:trimeric autotransporter adhesin